MSIQGMRSVSTRFVTVTRTSDELVEVRFHMSGEKRIEITLKEWLSLAQVAIGIKAFDDAVGGD